MMIAVVPQVEGLYRDLGKPLPVLTQVLVAISNSRDELWWLITVVLGLCGVVLCNFGRRMWDRSGCRW